MGEAQKPGGGTRSTPNLLRMSQLNRTAEKIILSRKAEVAPKKEQVLGPTKERVVACTSASDAKNRIKK